MKNEYYGVVPSSDFFAHYGVRGMKWGVRKAIERGNERALSRNYMKAYKKLQKLSDRANADHNSRQEKRYDRISGIATVLGASDLADIANTRAALSAARNSKGGRQRSIAKRDAWRKQMSEAFRGTRYANLPKIKKNNGRG